MLFCCLPGVDFQPVLTVKDRVWFSPATMEFLSIIPSVL